MPSSRLSDARPVRTRFKSLCRTSMVFSMCSFISAMSFSLMRSALNGCSDCIAEHHFSDVARLGEVKNDHRQLVVHAQRNGGGVHEPQPFIEHLQVADIAVAQCRPVHHRVL